ncbi:hypothetical protein [Thalassobacillus hwangdonensis]|uniref:DUF5673 domain-containing protein n=1 Tax=Thalassobacillus hwangdonensis TaxID=546108 RepID=A0ABW3L5C0_9BACI
MDERRRQILLTIAIILFISSLLIPFVVVFLLQDLFFTDRSQWFFITPTTAYITFMAGMMWPAIVIFIHLLIQTKYNFKSYKWVSIALIPLSIPVLLFGLTNYYYFDDQGINYNHLTTTNQMTYEWDGFKEVEKIYSKEDGTTTLVEYRFLTKKDEEIFVPVNMDFRNYQSRILKYLEENKVKVIDSI